MVVELPPAGWGASFYTSPAPLGLPIVRAWMWSVPRLARSSSDGLCAAKRLATDYGSSVRVSPCRSARAEIWSAGVSTPSTLRIRCSTGGAMALRMNPAMIPSSRAESISCTSAAMWDGQRGVPRPPITEQPDRQRRAGFPGCDHVRKRGRIARHAELITPDQVRDHRRQPGRRLDHLPQPRRPILAGGGQ